MPEQSPVVDLPEHIAPAFGQNEVLIRGVRNIGELVFNDKGQATLSPAAISRQDLQNRYISVIREVVCDGHVLTLRCAFINRDSEWLGDPVVARCLADNVVTIQDKGGRVEMRIERKPLRDRLGEFLAHAGMMRNPPHPDDRQTYQDLRTAIALLFDEISHLSGSAVSERTPRT